MNVELQLIQRQTLSQQQIQYLQILALNNEELNSYMENEYLENPMLEKDNSAEDRCGAESTSLYDPASVSDANVVGPEIAAKQKEMLPDFVLTQLDLRQYSRREQEIFEYLTMNLDSRGYLLVPAQAAAAQLHTAESEIQCCLQILKTLEPAGIFSENLEECIALQLKRKGLYTEELEKIIKNYLKELADGRYNAISKALDISTITVRKAAALIAEMNPFPLRGYNDEEIHYIVPDVLAGISSEREERWEIALNHDNLQLYRISDFYLHMLEKAKDPELSAYFQKRLTCARFLMRAIEQREKTILNITEHVLDWQKDYVRHGLSLKPMTMQDIASACGIHASTVSRAVRNKYLQYPGGTVLMKKLFTGMHTGECPESAQTPDHIKRRILDWVNTEDKHHPYSDQALTEAFLAENIVISRRTIAKYRKDMGVASASARKQIETL